MGLALFNIDFELIYRFPEPVVSPGVQQIAPDYLGVEDPRVTKIGDSFYIVGGALQPGGGGVTGELLMFTLPGRS